MLVWIAALHCEAKPIIDYYRLKKSPEHHAFDVYQRENMQCIISGIGKTSAAAATAWIAALNRKQASIAWINIGTAGSASHEIGTLLWISKISDIESKRHYYPVPLLNSGLETAHCQTLNQPSIDYHLHQIYDMEASALFEAATRFSSAELVHCLKIVSDNPCQQTGRDKARISELIHQHIAQLTDFAESLSGLNNQLADLEIKRPTGQ
jgi:adenosylhomocysteine nucleosidase